MKHLSFVLAVGLLMAGLLVSSCQSGGVTNGKKSIVVTYSVLGSLVKDLVGNQADVTVLMPNGVDPHDWEASAKDIERINKADLVVENGLNLEAGIIKALETAKEKGVKVFTATDHTTVRYVGAGEGIPSDDPDQAVGAPDPHIWMDPVAMKAVVDALALTVRQELNLDVTAQAQDLDKRLDALNQEVAATVSAVPAADRKLVTGHESMGYFARRYDFKLVGVIIPSLTSTAEVSAGDMAELEQVIRDNQVKAIFTELGTSPRVAQAIGKAAGVKVIEVTTHGLPGDFSYFTFMRNIATLISNGLK